MLNATFSVRLHVMRHMVLLRPFCPSVCLSNAWIVIKRKKHGLIFLYYIKEYLSQFSDKNNGWWGQPLLPEILDQTDAV